MNIDSLNIEFDSSEGAVRRLLGVIEARGFQVRAMSMGTDIERSRMTVGLTPRDPGRCLDILSRQIARVQGVRHVARMAAGPSVAMEAAHATRG